MYCSGSEPDWWWLRHLKTITTCGMLATYNVRCQCRVIHPLLHQPYTKSVVEFKAKAIKVHIIICSWNLESTHWWWELRAQVVLDGRSTTQTASVMALKPEGGKKKKDILYWKWILFLFHVKCSDTNVFIPSSRNSTKIINTHLITQRRKPWKTIREGLWYL